MSLVIWFPPIEIGWINFNLFLLNDKKDDLFDPISKKVDFSKFNFFKYDKDLR